jgi:hypothetical protein
MLRSRTIRASVGCAPTIDFGTAGVSSPGAVTGMDHILLTVSDMSRSVEFYRDVMGMRMEGKLRKAPAKRTKNL